MIYSKGQIWEKDGLQRQIAYIDVLCYGDERRKEFPSTEGLTFNYFIGWKRPVEGSSARDVSKEGWEKWAQKAKLLS